MNKIAKKTPLISPLLSFENFSFYHQKNAKKPTLNKLNLIFFPNTVTAIIGPSGCGKSTLLAAINRLHELKYDDTKVEGNIIFNGEKIYQPKLDTNKLRKKIGLVFQKPTPFPMSIRDNVLFAPRIHGTKNQKELELLLKNSLKQVNLWEEVKKILDQSALNLSGGQQQRLCLARCLANQPQIILMDEPTSSLDPISREKIEQLITVLKKKYTIILVTHSLSQASRISDYAVFLYQGKVWETAKTKHFFTEPKRKKTLEYISGKFD